ncbi:hypothetical protein SFRURICE_009198 [Spodoptera frugiperda]|nr:hypothetical protein SFRURICE_009198 [Spodoptera frugiperda]
MTEVAHRLSTSKSTDDVINILHRTYEVYMRINTDRKSQRTTVGQSAPSFSSPSPSPITSPLSDYRRANQWMTSQISCIAHMKFACELTRIEIPNVQQLGRKPARHDHLAWSEDPPFLRELYSLF